MSNKYSQLLSHLSSLKTRHLTIINFWILNSYITIVHMGVFETFSQGELQAMFVPSRVPKTKIHCTKAHSRKPMTLLDFLIENR